MTPEPCLFSLAFEQGAPNPKSELCLVYELFPALWKSPGDMGATLKLCPPSLPLKPRLQALQQKPEAFRARISKGAGCVCAHNIWMHAHCMLNPPHVQEKRGGFAFVRQPWHAPKLVWLRLPSPTLCVPVVCICPFCWQRGGVCGSRRDKLDFNLWQPAFVPFLAIWALPTLALPLCHGFCQGLGAFSPAWHSSEASFLCAHV